MKNTIKKTITFITVLALALTLATPVTAEAATKVKLNKTKVTLNVKKTCQLKVTGTKKKVTWKSNKPKVAKVNSKGKVTAVAKGTATITAKISGKKYTCKVTVKQPVTSVTLNKKTATLTKKGATVTLKATAKPSNANNRKITWKSSNTKVATVSGNGKVTAVANGTATITATAADGSGKKANCKITVKIAGTTPPAVTEKPTECQHDWKEHVVTTGTAIICNGCGQEFSNNEEFTEHSWNMSMNGDYNHNGCGITPITTVDYEYCTKCGAKRNVQ